MQYRRIGSMATFPAREKTLGTVVARLARQLDTLYVYLNDYDSVPVCLSDYENIVPVLASEKYGNLRANGKMIYLDYDHEDSMIFLFDDDILFPDDYVFNMSEILQSLNNKVALSVHGSVIPDSASWYYDRTVTYDATKPLKCHTAINLVGSGTYAYHSDSIKMNMDAFLSEVYVDLKLSLSALEQNVPLLAIARDSNYIEFVPYEGLWEEFRTKYTHHTDILLSTDVWKLDSLKRIWKNFLDSEAEGGWLQYVLDKNIDLEFASYAYGGAVPLDCRASKTTLIKILARKGIS